MNDCTPSYLIDIEYPHDFLRELKSTQLKASLVESERLRAARLRASLVEAAQQRANRLKASLVEPEQLLQKWPR